MTPPATNRFIVLRGPSGSGKTTIAKQLFDLAVGRTAIIHQDDYRFMFKPGGEGGRQHSALIHDLIEHNCKTALAAGYDVILEGILNAKGYSEILKRIADGHVGPSFFFYFDISFEETARRHSTRSSTFTTDDMREWYDANVPLGHPMERLIPEHLSIAQVVELISKT